MNPLEEKVKLEKDPLQTLFNCDGYYKCPQTSDGKLLGPLVGYTGEYAAADGSQKHYVGMAYYNFAKAEPFFHVVDQFAYLALCDLINLTAQDEFNIYPFDTFLCAPMGSLVFGQALARQAYKMYKFAEKVVVEAGKAGQRAETRLGMSRHEIEPGERVVIVEDVFNNFRTTTEMVSLVQNAGGVPIALIGAINRSPEGRVKYLNLPIASAVFRPTPEFKQEDPEVAEYIASGQIVWEPKHNWAVLKAAMDEHQHS